MLDYLEGVFYLLGGGDPLATNPLISTAFSGYRRAVLAVFPLPPGTINNIWDIQSVKFQITNSSLFFKYVKIRLVFLTLNSLFV